MAARTAPICWMIKLPQASMRDKESQSRERWMRRIRRSVCERSRQCCLVGGTDLRASCFLLFSVNTTGLVSLQTETGFSAALSVPLASSRGLMGRAGARRSSHCSPDEWHSCHDEGAPN